LVFPAESRLIALGRASPEVVTALVAEVRNKDSYRLKTSAAAASTVTPPQLVSRK